MNRLYKDIAEDSKMNNIGKIKSANFHKIIDVTYDF